MSSFDKAFLFTIKNEGSYSDHPADRGGATSQYGVTQEELARWRRHSVSKLDVKNMQEWEAREIYLNWYFKPLGCERIQMDGVAICMFDIGVECGIGASAILAQRTANSLGSALTEDGHIGPKSIQAINSYGQREFIQAFKAKVDRRFYGIVAGRPSQIVFLKGWLNRSKRLLTLIEA